MTSPSPSPSSAAAASGALNPMQLDAKNLYVTQLAEVVGPHILKSVASMLDAVCQESGSKVLLRFQGSLRAVPLWNSEVIRGHAGAIEAKAPYLERLIAVTFLSFVKVMSSVKLRESDRPNIRIKLPTTDAFVHKVFINVARDFYAIPSTPVAEYEGMRAAVERAIRDMLPIEDILNAYLGTAVDDDNTVSPTLEEGVVGADADDAPAPPQFPAYAPADMCAVPPTDMCAVPPQYLADPVEHHHCRPQDPPEMRTISTISVPPSVKDDDLFSDADDDGADWRTPVAPVAPPVHPPHAPPPPVTHVSPA